ncbi:MAG: D-alanyl-D-alanine-carboxypeptidase/endopeptidase AmpH [Hyphomicrobiales bacterium]|nr:D-alanyl-D-alanine-carboxypeptidase/endopeptidase AmpH [Hyphomicrobiales bacterium]
MLRFPRLAGLGESEIMRCLARLRALTTLLIGLIWAGCAGGALADEASLRDAVGLTAAAMWLNFKSPGLVLAVVRGEDTVVLGFGETAKGSKLEPNGRTLLRIGSVSKAFAGELLASLAAEGKVKLADAAANFLPGVTLPVTDGRPITLIDLVTHSAGFPRDLPGEAPPGTNPYERFSWENDKAYFASAKLAFVPGTAAAYSNVGFDLLGAALAGAAGTSYAELLKTRITGPLGMRDTGLRLDEAQKARLMTGYDFEGNPMEPFEALEAQGASGGVYSTADDMVRFMRWHLDRKDPAGDSVRVIDHAVYLQRDGLKMAVGFDEGGKSDAIGLAWLAMNPDGARPFILQKTGGFQGFMSYMAFAPSRGVGVFVAVNQFNFGGFIQMAETANGLIGELAPR